MAHKKVNIFDPTRERELRSAVEAFFFGYRTFTALPDRTLSARGLGRTHHRILYFVRRDDGLGVSDLIDVLGVTKQALHRPIKDLESQGLLSVVADADDRRVRRLYVTESGRALEAELVEGQMRLLDDAFGQAGAGAETAWLAIMQALPCLDEA